MSAPEIASEKPGAHTPVFVDDSGRRRARLRIVVRVVVGMLVLYTALAAVSLVAPVSLPIAHLGDLGVLPRHRQRATLGPLSKEVPLPAALAPSRTGTGDRQTPTATTIGTSQTTTPSATTPAGVIVPPGQTSPSAATTIPTSRTTPVTTAPGVDTTTTPPTTGRSSTSTLPHGPPSTTPGKGSKP